jgi:hypothetical protein
VRLFWLRLALATGAAFALLVQLATGAGIAAGVLGVGIGYWMAERASKRPLRTLPVLALTALVPMVLGGVAAFIGNHPLGLSPLLALQVCDFIGVFGVAIAAAFAGHLASERIAALSALEPALALAAIVSIFANHRHHRIEHPRFLSDWAWSNGIDPVQALAVLGVIAALAALLLLLREATSRSAILVLLLIGGIVLLLPPAAIKPPPPVSNSAQSSKDESENDKDKSGGASNSRPPRPVAIMVLHDELPADLDAIYLRQGVLSRVSGDRMVEDTSGAFDKDIVAHIPSPPSVSTQNPLFHRKTHTSIYLLADHSALFGPAQPYALRAIPNPNPTRFVGAYDVDSHWLRVSPSRLAGRATFDPQWNDDEREHYSKAPSDPRYLALSKQVVRDVDPRFVGDDVAAAHAIKRYLETHGTYNSKKKELTGEEPTAAFLFGDLHGYCVHFAHAAALLLRSQGIAARVALGYAVQTRLRGAGSSVLVLENQAHAWPEIYLSGVGWVTFDIHPERSDDPPPQLVDVELESVLGEMARKDPPKESSKKITREMVLQAGAFSLAVFLALAYAVKLVRRVRASSPALVYRSVLDSLSGLGARRRMFETRERHAERIRQLAPSFVALTQTHLRHALGQRDARALSDARSLARATREELARNTQTRARISAWLNPVAWWFTR